MIVEFGHAALIASLFIALIQTGVPFCSSLGDPRRTLRVTQVCVVFNAILLVGAFGSLIFAYIQSDFSYLNVALNSHQDMPIVYKISGVWGNHEGSMLLWVLILSFYSVGIAYGPVTLYQLFVIGTQGFLSFIFQAFILFSSNPFLKATHEILQGQGLNPILQDPALALHPPLLYLGYVGTTLGFSYAVAGMLKKKVDLQWAKSVHPWVLISWGFLTLGISLGSWWAYYELGWGGWWFWDPVENASLMPWLTGCALLHSLLVFIKKGSLRTWSLLLALSTFGFSLIGTFLVRSGLLSSIHAFAVDPERGLYILFIILSTLGGGFVLYALRASSLRAQSLPPGFSREHLLVLNTIFLMALLVTVFVGTLYPLFGELLFGVHLSVGAPYFHFTFVPIGLVAVGAMGVMPEIPWQPVSLKKVLFKSTQPSWMLSGFLMGVVSVLMFHPHPPVLAVMAFGCACGVVLSTLQEWGKVIQKNTSQHPMRQRLFQLPLRTHAMPLSHMGIAVLIFGMTTDVLWTQEHLASLSLGGTLSFAGYEVTFTHLNRQRLPLYMSEKATLEISQNGRKVAKLYPEKRFYKVHQTLTTETALWTQNFSDLYVVLGPNLSDKRWAFRFYHHPQVAWIWIGGMIIALGGFCAVFRSYGRDA